jgi:two-component system response regulator HydG
MVMKPPFAPVVLIIDDDELIRKSLGRALRGEGFEILYAENGVSALEILKQRKVDLSLLDLNMPGMPGTETLEHIHRGGYDVDVIVLTAHGDVKLAVECMKTGAVDFLEKPFEVEDLRRRIKQALQQRLLRREEQLLRERSKPKLVGQAPVMRKLHNLIDRVSQTSEIVLIRGESGTGKELIARLIHQKGPNASDPFLPIDCTTLTPTVVESELFGHMKGSFTGADNHKMGLLKAAGKGTVFLDEIGDMPLELQPKLLRAMQEREFRPVGGTKMETFHARILVATNRNLESLMKEGRLREDLYYRINVITIMAPPLRDRRDDIVELARHFIRQYDTSTTGPRDIDPLAAESLANYDWPGNVRELENSIRRLLVLHPEALITSEMFPEQISPAGDESTSKQEAPLHEMEIRLIRAALDTAKGNVTTAAKKLGISKNTIYRRMKTYGIKSPRNAP